MEPVIEPQPQAPAIERPLCPTCQQVLPLAPFKHPPEIRAWMRDRIARYRAEVRAKKKQQAHDAQETA